MTTPEGSRSASTGDGTDPASARPATTPRPAATPTPATRAAPASSLHRRLAELRGDGILPRPLDARALAALAANPGCHRRALLDGAGVDKGAVAERLGAPAAFGQSQFAFVRGNAFEARVKADGGAELIALLCARTGAERPEPEDVAVPDLSAPGPAGRAERTRLALEEAAATGGWSLLDHPMLALEIAGSTAYLEPDAVAVHPDGSRTVLEIKSFPILDGSADPAKVGAAARQAAVYVLALEALGGGPVGDRALLVCPKDFSNLPTGELVDLRKQRAATARQLTRLTRVERIAAELPEGTCFDPDPSRPASALFDAVESVPATYAPECLASCELAFHCRARAREEGAVEALGRTVRGELGGLTTIPEVRATAYGASADDEGPASGEGSASERGPDSGDARFDELDPAAPALRRAAALRAEALKELSCR